MTPREIATLEESWQALGISETSPEVLEIGGGYACFAEPGSWQNQAMGLGMEGPVSDEALDRFIAFYVERGVPPRIEVCPFADKSLVRGLRARDLTLKDFETVLYRPLEGAIEHLWPEGLELVEVDPTDESQVRRYVETLHAGFSADAEEPTPPGPGVRAGTRVANHPRVTTFLVEHEGEPVGGGALEIATPLARLIGASVLPSHRKRGIQTALLSLRCRLGREAGCTFATVQSRPGGGTERNAVRGGFRVACTKVTLER